MAGRPDFRMSQGVIPFGVGAITDFPEESLMTAGLDVWPYETAEGEMRVKILDASKVLDGRLAKRLSINLGRRIDFFLSPSEAPEYGFAAAAAAGLEGRAPMPFVRFPNWYFCPRCRVLKRIPWNIQSRDWSQLKCSNKGRRVEGKGDPCGSLPNYRRPSMSPVRFVIACISGHIMDFPWIEWAHSRSKEVCDGGSGDLYLYSTPAAGLAGVIVQCVKCKQKRSMVGAFQQNVLDRVFENGCPGERPWLGPDAIEHNCDQIPQTIQRGASNAYFAKVVSSILIPPYSALMMQTLDRPDLWQDITNLPRLEGKLPEKWLRQKAEGLGLDPDIFVKAVNERLQEEESGADIGESDQISEEEYRLAEYKAYKGQRPPKQERHDFDTKSVPISEYDGWFGSLIEKVVLVKKLRETRVLTAFSRVFPPELLDGAPAELSINPKSWLPGFSVRGEGIFLELKEKALTKWAEEPLVAVRTAQLQKRLNKLHGERSLEERPIKPELILAHTFAHLLIRQLSFECGYDNSSLRERLYISGEEGGEMRGLLIYTASGDSEGTLGGLVRQGDPGRLDKTIQAAMENAAICSSDPLCIESTGQGTYGLNLSACHACCLLPETSCEEGNLLLDRALVVGTADQPEIGYFQGII